MNIVNTSDLKPGQVFSAPVYTQGRNLLVPALIPLRQKDIDILLSWGIATVSTEGAVIKTIEEEVPEELTPEEPDSAGDFPGGDSLEDFFKDTGISDDFLKKEETPVSSNVPEEDVFFPAQQRAIKFSISDVKQNSGPYRAYKNLIEKLSSVFIGIKTGIDVDMRAVDNICVQLLQDLREHPDSFIDYILGGEVIGHELAKSSVNTAILSALTAQELKLPHHKIHNIVAGALLHDIGMLRLSKGITEKKGGLSDAELEQIKSHPLHTSKIVTKELFGPHEVNLIALQHHERWDGKGYPDHIFGPAIDIGARIVSVADAFEAMVTKKSYRNSMGGYQAVKNLLADNARRFDPSVISVFTKIMGIYPIGSIVRLNDSSVARVVKVHPDAPLRPVVQMLMDEKARVLSAEKSVTIDLLAEKKLFIKEAIDPAYFAGSSE